MSKCKFGGKIIFPAKPTSNHSYWKTSRCRFCGITNSPANFTSTCVYSDFHVKQVDVKLVGKIIVKSSLNAPNNRQTYHVVVVDVVAASFIVVAAALTYHQCKHHHW
jgi:hypothetical protein